MENKLVLIKIDQLYAIIKQAILEVIKKKDDEDQQKEILNFKETCEFLGIHPSTLNKWKAQNKIPYKRLGKRIFFERKRIQAALKESNYCKLKEIQVNL
ncbi:MAG: helix-turn-helix domain-containing protein [Ignavibacteriae bacterium]|nr:helix-turn-helix domain-containing protein [Ignavibacteriota bacterium]